MLLIKRSSSYLFRFYVAAFLSLNWISLKMITKSISIWPRNSWVDTKMFIMLQSLIIVGMSVSYDGPVLSYVTTLYL